MDAAYYKKYFELEENHWLFKIRRKIFFSLIEKYKISKEAEIFDFGCGSGYFVGFLQEKGFYHASGSDISEEAIRFGQSKGIRNLFIAEEAELDYKERFDLILSLDVIEHIKDDAKAIAKIEAALKPGGAAIIIVPAYMWMWGIQDEVSHHYRRYTQSNLKKIIRANTDFQILRSSYFNTLLFPGIALVRILSRIFGFKERQSDFDLGNNFLNTIFYFVFNLEAILLKYINFPFGVSILVVLKKSEQSV